jgi:hypothetical protein
MFLSIIFLVFDTFLEKRNYFRRSFLTLKIFVKFLEGFLRGPPHTNNRIVQILFVTENRNPYLFILAFGQLWPMLEVRRGNLIGSFLLGLQESKIHGMGLFELGFQRHLIFD